MAAVPVRDGGDPLHRSERYRRRARAENSAEQGKNAGLTDRCSEDGAIQDDELANSIFRQAVKNYRMTEDEKELKEIERFFRSG